ncbi:hypothetical protein CK203_059480 [Vitis vinifera]|uniref:Uncharacterized protein n=1 Tax=Vitis vinifera TaxID=29760 RepID=A0A438GBX5_VITVI|nr:hypothetical protein CK203_059480 [Vitis vinifera]
MPHVTSSSLPGRPFEASGEHPVQTICATERTLPILTFASVGVHAQPQVNNKVEGMASCVMMRHLTQPPNCLAEVTIALALLCNHHYISQLNTAEPPSTLEHYKSTTEIKEMADLWKPKSLTSAPKWELSLQRLKGNPSSVNKETKRLKEEKEVLRIQVSSSAPPHSPQLKSQCANSRRNEEAAYPRNVDFLHAEQGMQPKQRSPLVCHPQQDESFDSTCVS